MSEIQPFTFPATGQAVRIVQRDGEPWFVAADVADVLGYGGGARNAIVRIPERMKGVEDVNTPGGIQKMTVISESGAYRLVMRSNLPTAEAFQDWLAEDVVPAIRRTGSYSVATAPRLPDLASPEGVLALAEQFHETAKALVAAGEKIAELEPKAVAHDRYLTADKGDRLVREVAKLLGWREKDLRAFLLDEGLIFRKQSVCSTYYYDAYARHAEHFRPVEKVVEHTWGPCSHYTLYVRPSGVELIRRRIEKRKAAIEQSIGGA
jgi:prophage antirepressor-like protein